MLFKVLFYLISILQRYEIEGSGWGTHVYLWRIHFDIRQNQYNIVKLKKKKYEIVNKHKYSKGKVVMIHFLKGSMI